MNMLTEALVLMHIMITATAKIQPHIMGALIIITTATTTTTTKITTTITNTMTIMTITGILTRSKMRT